MGRGRARYFRPHELSYAQQQLLMRTYPQFRAIPSRTRIVWVGTLTPCDLGRKYTVTIEYRLGHRPTVRVVKPVLELYPGAERIPHTFRDGTLCLHLHEEWHGGLSIAAEIVPWVSLWLLFYEAWLATGKWLGEGHEIAEDEK
jgi:hypothetical protein